MVSVSEFVLFRELIEKISFSNILFDHLRDYFYLIILIPEEDLDFVLVNGVRLRIFAFRGAEHKIDED